MASLYGTVLDIFASDYFIAISYMHGHIVTLRKPDSKSDWVYQDTIHVGYPVRTIKMSEDRFKMTTYVEVHEKSNKENNEEIIEVYDLRKNDEPVDCKVSSDKEKMVLDIDEHS